MAVTEVGLRISLKDRKVAARQLKDTKSDVTGVGDAAARAGRKAAASEGGWRRWSGALGKARLGVLGVVTALGAFGVAGVSMGAVLHTGIQEQTDFLAGQSQLAAGIKSTGGVAGVTVNQLENLASSIQNYSGQTDDSIVGSEKLLLTFTNIRNQVGKNNDIFTQATKISADLAARMGGDASKSAIQLGKALNDPVKGISALTRVGVSFDAQQQKQIKSLVKAGNVMGAQKLILKELRKEFGGSAAAYGKTLPGMLARAKRAYEDVSQAVVNAFMPALMGGANLLLHTVLPAFARGMSTVTGYVTRAVHSPVWAQVRAVGEQMFHTVLTTWLPQIETVIGNLVHFGQAVLPVLLPLAVMLGKTLATAAGLAWRAIQRVSAVLVPVGDWIASHKTLVQSLVVGLLALVGAWKAWTLATTVWKTVTGAATKVQAAFNVVMDANPIMLVVVGLAALAAGLIYAYKHSEAFRNVVQGVFGWLKSSATSVWHFMQKWGPLILTAVAPVIGLPLLIWQHWSQIASFAARAWNGAIGFLQSVPGRILRVFVGANVWLLDVGAKIVRGLFRGIRSAFSKGLGFATDIAKQIANGVIGFIDSKVIDPIKGFHFTISALGFHHTFQPFGSLPDIPKLAKGGRTQAGHPYVVGDGGRPELFVPDVDGTVLPRVPSPATLAAPALADFDLDDADIAVGPGPGGDIYLTVELDGKAVYQVVVEKQKKTVARQ